MVQLDKQAPILKISHCKIAHMTVLTVTQMMKKNDHI